MYQNMKNNNLQQLDEKEGMVKKHLGETALGQGTYKQDCVASEAACPYNMINPELCRAAISSLMIHLHYCFSQAYEDCPLFLINKAKICALTPSMSVFKKAARI